MKRTYLLMMCVLTTLIMTATQFSQKEAKQTAEQFLKQKAGKVASTKATRVVPINLAKSSAADNDCKTMTLKVENTGTGTFHGDIGMFNQDLSGALSYMTCDIEPGETIDLNMRIVPKKTGTINYEIITVR